MFTQSDIKMRKRTFLSQTKIVHQIYLIINHNIIKLQQHLRENSNLTKKNIVNIKSVYIVTEMQLLARMSL